MKETAQRCWTVFHSVGKAGFEPAASTSRTWRAAKLRYFPLLRDRCYRITAITGHAVCGRRKPGSLHSGDRGQTLAVGEFVGALAQVDELRHGLLLEVENDR
jgi:hypothetical protein